MSPNKVFCRDVLEQLNRVAPVTARAMFGGYGLYTAGNMFALIAAEKLYFKVGDLNRAAYISAGMEPFMYERNGKLFAMSYYQLPSSVFEDLETLSEWIENAYQLARQSKTKSKSRKQKLKEIEL